MGRRFAAALLVTSSISLLLAAPEGVSAQSPDGMLLPGEKVQDTMAPTGETKTAGFAGVAGMRCTFSARALPKSRVLPTLAVTDPGGTPVELGKKHHASGGRAKVTGLVLDATGLWRVSVSTPTDHGGAFELSTVAKAPTRATTRGTINEDPASAEATFGALPGATLTSLTVTAKGKPAWTPSFELFAPDGTSLGKAVGKRSRATLRGVVLPEVGNYRVVVTGGLGKYSLAASLRPPKRTPRTWKSAEALPQIFGVSPLVVNNDTSMNFILDGVGFSTRQTLRLVQNGATRFAAQIGYASQTAASVPADLPGLEPGTYDVQIGTPAANSVIFGTPLVVNNRPPAIIRTQPTMIPNGASWDVLLTGAGFDPGVAVTVRRHDDGLEIPTTLVARTSHRSADLSVSPPAAVAGPCDIEVRDPDGATTTLPNALDVLGYRGIPKAFRTYTGSDVDTTCYPRDAAYDPAAGRVCIAMREGGRAVWVVVDTSTWSVVDTWTVTPSGSNVNPNPRVAWSPVDGTWALCWTSGTTAYLRIAAGASLQSTLGQYTLGSSIVVNQVHAAADPERGGFIVIHDRWGGGSSDGEIWSLHVAPDGSADTTKQTKLASAPNGLAFMGSIAWSASERFVVTYVGADDSLYQFAIRRIVLNENGHVFYPSLICAIDGDWEYLFQPELAINPKDGSILIAFTYLRQSEYHPACLVLEPGIASPGDLVSLDDEGLRPQGFNDSVVWNPTRGEFVIGLTIAPFDVAIRRVTPAGKIVPAQYLQKYEGAYGTLWSGPTADTLGLVHAFDGDANGTYGGTGKMHLHGGPIR